MQEENMSDSNLSYIKINFNESTNDNIDISFTKEIQQLSPNQQICCIEMINNNKLYIKYELNWTIRDVIINKSAYKSDNYE
jgi:hypothetical protein